MALLDFVGFKRHRAGRIHLFCPSCKKKLSNMRREEHDPPAAVLAQILCEKCSIRRGAMEPSTTYLDARGREVSPWTACRECSEEVGWSEVVDGACAACRGERERAS